MKVIVLAAGKGSRISTNETQCIPKVLREVSGKALVSYVLEKLPPGVTPEDVYIVVGYMEDMVRDRLGTAYHYCRQTEQLGTGHAVAMCRDALQGYDGPVLVLYGDMPLFTRETYESLAAAYHAGENDAAVLLCDAPKDKIPPYGRAIIGADGRLCEVVEERDCTAEQKKITLVNVGVYVFSAKKMFDALTKVKNENAQGEYYLPDVIKILLSEGGKVSVFTMEDIDESIGINTMEDLQYCQKLMESGKYR